MKRHAKDPPFPNEQTLRELAAPQFDALTSAGLVPHKVTTISYAPPRSGARQLEASTSMRCTLKSRARHAEPMLTLFFLAAHL